MCGGCGVVLREHSAAIAATPLRRRSRERGSFAAFWSLSVRAFVLATEARDWGQRKRPWAAAVPGGLQAEDDGVIRELTEKEVMKMSRFKLKVELAKRNLETTGNKRALRAGGCTY